MSVVFVPLTQKGYSIMKHGFKGLATMLPLTVSSATFLLLRFAKISPIIGSKLSFFSLSDAVMPLAGTAGLGFASLIVALRMTYRVGLLGIPLSHLFYHLPGFCASAYWATESKLVRLILPLACMVAFVVHPVGSQAAAYSLYWLIPVALYFTKRKTVFLESLGSTFIAHGVGSVIWLYMFNIPAATWLALIPVVAVERLFFASTMTVVYTVCSSLKNRTVTYLRNSSAWLGQA